MAEFNSPSDENSSSPSPGNPILAVFLTMVLGGMGHFYAGYSLGQCIAVCLAMLSSAFGLAMLASFLPNWQTAMLVILAGNITVVLIACWHCLRVIREQRRLPRSVTDYLVMGVTVLLLGTCFRLGMDYAGVRPIQVYQVPTRSMLPNIVPGDRIACSASPYLFGGTPQYGDVIAFDSVTNDDVTYVKRIIGLPGDRVAIRKDRVYVNDQELAYEAIGDSATMVETIGTHRHLISHFVPEDKPDFAVNFSPLKVPEDEVFVLGDFRRNSADSRTYGPVPFANIRGRCDGILWGTQASSIIPGQRGELRLLTKLR